MKFLINRVSRQEPPHKNAQKVFFNVIESWAIPTFDEWNKRFSVYDGDWQSKGINHKETEGHIIREFPDDKLGFWIIEIDDLNELLEICSETEDRIILDQTVLWMKERGIDGSIEIYDDYRE